MNYLKLNRSWKKQHNKNDRHDGSCISRFWKWRVIIAVNFPIEAIGKKPEKNQGFNGIRIRDLLENGAMLYQLSYEATHWKRGPFIEFMSPVRSEMMWSIYEIIHISTAVVNDSEEWSSQWIFQFKRLERWRLKKIRASTGFEPVTSATELWSHTLGARSIYWDRRFKSRWSPDFFRLSGWW